MFREKNNQLSLSKSQISDFQSLKEKPGAFFHSNQFQKISWDKAKQGIIVSYTSGNVILALE